MLQPDRVHLIAHSMSRGRPISWHPKMAALPLPDKQNLLDLFREYDHDMQQQSDRIARAHRAIVARQIELKETFGDMIDGLIRVRDDDKHVSQDPKQDGREQTPQHDNGMCNNGAFLIISNHFYAHVSSIIWHCIVQLYDYASPSLCLKSLFPLFLCSQFI